jgi:hypothetical protein
LKTLIEKNKSCRELIPEVTLLEINIPREDKPVEQESQKESAKTKDEKRENFFKTFFSLLNEE